MTGHVAIVGGGPGAPDLLTLRGFELLKQADVVLVDRLAPQALLAGLRPDVEIIDVGKVPHRPQPSQANINEMLVDRARRGLRVVRLKGGDPYVFGRGAEEAAACARAGVPHEVVPGVSSATAAPLLAGIPVTHRGVVPQFTVVSGHAAPSDPGSGVDWASLARAGGTLVLLMAVTHIGEIAAALVDGGTPADTPVAAVCSAATPRQRTYRATLHSIASVVTAERIEPPAVFVVGEVVQLHNLLAPAAEPGG